MIKGKDELLKFLDARLDVKDFREVTDYIDKLPFADWIDVKDRLPDIGQVCDIIYIANDEEQIMYKTIFNYYDEICDFCFTIINQYSYIILKYVKAWRPAILKYEDLVQE